MKNQQTDTRFKDLNNGEPLAFADIFILALRWAGDRGVDAVDLVERAPVIKALKAVGVGEEIKLSHEEWALVDGLFQDRKWPVDDGIIECAVALLAEMESPLALLEDEA
jgi:hypothetical protein